MDNSIVIAKLQSLYRDARCERIATAPLRIPAGHCRYGCGRRWQSVVTSRLDGHAICIVTPEFCIELARVFAATPGLGPTHIALALGVNRRIVQRWLRADCQTPQLRACP